MRILRYSFLLFCTYAILPVHAQTQSDWARTVNWDGVSHWSRYIISLPAHMGPNALMVPSIGNGSVDSVNSFTATGHFHFRQGDQTQNLALYGNYCLAKNVVSIDLYYIPFEHYTMSDTLKRARHVYYKNWNEHFAQGDVIMNTTIRILKKWEKKIQLALRVGFRFPPSSGFAAARYTDNMGYYIDADFGKTINPSLKWIGMAGIYCWQVDKDDLRQDDALLFGTGLEYNHHGWQLQGYLAGYLGYMENQGDKPILARLATEKKCGSSSLIFRLQQGLHDFKYSSVEIGGKWDLKRKAR